MSCSYWQVILTLILTIVSSTLGTETDSATLTPDEKRLQLIEGSMARYHSPCSDFFKYACSEWHHVKKNFGIESLQILDSGVESDMDTALDQLVYVSDLKFLGEIKNYYESCSANDKPYMNTINYLKWMKAYEGVPWPLVVGNNSSAQDLEWLELLAITRKFGFNEIFFYEDVAALSGDPFEVAIEFQRPSLSPLNDFQAQIFDFKDLIATEDIEKFATFQKDLAKLIVKMVEKQEGFVNLLRYQEKPNRVEANATTLRDLEMPWLERYLRVLLDRKQLDANMVVYVQNATYLKNVYDFLSKYENRFLCDYIQIKFLMFLLRNDEYSKRGNCVRSVRNQFPLAAQWMHKRKHSELQQDVPLIKEIFSNLKGKFKKTLARNVYNFTEDIVEYLQAKIDSLQLSIDEILANDLESYYETLTLSSTDYYGNRLRLNRLHFNKRHSLLSSSLLNMKMRTIDMLQFRPDDSDASASDKSALYNLPYLFPRFNVIYLPLTLLQNPYYTHDMDDLYKYSTIGFLLGRQIAMAFDLDHLQVDAKGFEQNTMYRKMLSNRNFAKTSEKLSSDFRNSDFQMEGAIADLGGLKLAFDTLAEVQPKFTEETVTMHNETITKDKLFFLSYSQNYCSALCSFGLMGTQFYDQCEHVSKPVTHFGKFRHAFKCSNDKKAPALWH